MDIGKSIILPNLPHRLKYLELLCSAEAVQSLLNTFIFFSLVELVQIEKNCLESNLLCPPLWIFQEKNIFFLTYILLVCIHVFLLYQDINICLCF